MKFILFLFFLLRFFLPVTAQNVSAVFRAFQQNIELQNASIGMMAVDLTTGDTILAHNIKTSLPSASTAKLFSTASALELLGGDFKPVTKIYFDGKIDTNQILNGNLWIRGGGDPTLGSKYFSSPENRTQFLSEIVQLLKKQGIQKINGNLIVDASEFGYEGNPDNWTWSDIGNYYGAGFSGINLLDNTVELHFKTSRQIGGKTTITSTFPVIEDLKIQNYVTAEKSNKDNAYIYGAPYSNERFVTGSIPYNREKFIVKGSVPDTELLLGQLLSKELKKQSISIEGSIQTGRKMNLKSNDNSYQNRTFLFSLEGKTIREIVNLTNEKSINLFAESLVHLIGKNRHQSKLGTNKNGIKVIDNYWKSKINTTGLFLNDGSGLSRSNAISPSHFVELLTWMEKNENGKIFRKSLPISGETGTLKSLCKKQTAHGRVFAKSGTMRRIKSYAGYIDSSTGKRIAFAIIVNNYSGGSSNLRRKMEPIFNALSKF